MATSHAQRGKIGGLVRRGASPERIAEARAALKAAGLHEKIRAAVAEWPPLTDEQRIELAAILHPGLGSGNTT